MKIEHATKPGTVEATDPARLIVLYSGRERTVCNRMLARSAAISLAVRW